jgi:hypothetical protein
MIINVFNSMNGLEQIVTDYAKDRPIIFSTFQPDAAVLVRKLQSTYPVSFRLFFYCIEVVLYSIF